VKRLSAFLLAFLLCAPLAAQTVVPGGGGSPSGAAGGNLSGTYPDPTIASVPSAALPAGQYPGTSTDDDATAGNIGEIVEGDMAPGTGSLTTGTAAQLFGVSLSAGDWLVYANCYFTTTSTTTVTDEQCGANTANAIDATAGNFGEFKANALVVGAGTNVVSPGVPRRYSLSTTTTVRLIASSTFGASTMKIGGKIIAVRIR
jgi:hypothetical protein